MSQFLTVTFPCYQYHFRAKMVYFKRIFRMTEAEWSPARG